MPINAAQRDFDVGPLIAVAFCALHAKGFAVIASDLRTTVPPSCRRPAEQPALLSHRDDSDFFANEGTLTLGGYFLSR